jgi:hypothetical protein
MIADHLPIERDLRENELHICKIWESSGMKKYIFPLFLLFPIALLAQTTKIKIDIDRTIAEIDPKIYGVFMEPIQFTGKEQGLPETGSLNTLYGSLYDPASPICHKCVTLSLTMNES